MKIGSMAVSTLEYPGKLSLVIFTAGCNFRCPYCHNPELIDGGVEADLSDILKEMEKYAAFVDAVVVSGGEPLLQVDDVEVVLRHARSLGLHTKLDTNGYSPGALRRLLPLLDYVAVDVKAPFHRYRKLTGARCDGVRESLRLLARSDVTVECRTTFVPGLMDEEDLKIIAESIDCDIYVIQQFRNRVVLDEKLKNLKPPSPRMLRDLALKIKKYFRKVKIRTEEFGEEEIQ